MKISKLKI